MREDECIIRFCNALERNGFPKDAIVVGRSIRFGNRSVVYPDVAIVGSDHETVVAIFELKVNSDCKEVKYTRALHSYKEMVERCPCYVVSCESDGELLVARLSLASNGNNVGWVNVSDADGFVKLIGRYSVESAAAIDSSRAEVASAKQDELSPAKWIVGGVGLSLTIASAWMEWYHHEFSWKVYSVLFVTLGLFAAASGYSVYLKSGDHEVRIGRESSRQSKEDD